jgi:hypothetical protein
MKYRDNKKDNTNIGVLAIAAVIMGPCRSFFRNEIPVEVTGGAEDELESAATTAPLPCGGPLCFTFPFYRRLTNLYADIYFYPF